MSRPSWTDGPMTAWDTETTGPDPETARIVTSATAMIRPGEDTKTAEWLVDPGVEIPAEATRVHGITTEQARAEGGAPEAAAAMIVNVLAGDVLNGIPLVGFNLKYDLTVLDRECRRHGVTPLTDVVADASGELLIIDPFVLDKAVDRYRRGKRTLSAVADHYGVELTESEAHTASGDCLAAARVAWKLGRAYSEVGTLSLPQLQRYQAEAHAEWAAGFEQYLREKKGQTDAVISREWPVQPHTEEVAA